MYLSKRKKNNIWYIYFRQENGKKSRASTKTSIKREALQFLNDFQKKRVKGSSNKSNVSIGELSKVYLKSISITHTNNSYRLTKCLIEHFVESIGKEKPIQSIDQSICESYILKIYERSRQSAALRLRTYKAWFNKLIAWEYIEKSPFRLLKVKVPINFPVYINVDELKLIVSKESNPTLAKIYEFAFYTGMRISEIINLEWSDVNLEGKVVKVRNKGSFITKSKRERVIPMNEKVFSILSSFSCNGGYIFNIDNNQIRKEFASKRFKKCIRSTTLNNNLHLHSLRHSFASNLVQRGVSIYEVSKLLGHADIKTTQVYASLSQENLKAAVNMLND